MSDSVYDKVYGETDYSSLDSSDRYAQLNSDNAKKSASYKSQSEAMKEATEQQKKENDDRRKDMDATERVKDAEAIETQENLDWGDTVALRDAEAQGKDVSEINGDAVPMSELGFKAYNASDKYTADGLIKGMLDEGMSREEIEDSLKRRGFEDPNGNIANALNKYFPPVNGTDDIVKEPEPAPKPEKKYPSDLELIQKYYRGNMPNFQNEEQYNKFIDGLKAKYDAGEDGYDIKAKPETEKEPDPEVKKDLDNNTISDDEASNILVDSGLDDPEKAKGLIEAAGGRLQEMEGPNGTKMYSFDPADMTRDAWAEKYGRDNGKWQKIATLVSIAAAFLTDGAVPPINFMLLDNDKAGYDAWLENTKHDNDNFSDAAKEANQRALTEGTNVENKETLDEYDNEETERNRGSKRIMDDEELITQSKKDQLEINKQKALNDLEVELAQATTNISTAAAKDLDMAIKKNNADQWEYVYSKYKDQPKILKMVDKYQRQINGQQGMSHNDIANTVTGAVDTVASGVGDILDGAMPF